MKLEHFSMDPTKVATLARSADMAEDIAHGHVGENKCDVRIYGTSGSRDFIFSVM